MATAATAETLDGEATRYIALRRLRVGRGNEGHPVYREAGESIPEAEDWAGLTRARYIQEGHIAQVAVVPRGRGRPPKKAEASDD